MWRIPASTDSRSSSGSSRPASHWRPLTPNRSVHGGLPCRRRCRTAWISFFARVRECTSCSRRASRRRSTRQRSSGIHTDSSSPDHNKRASVRASSRSVFARACVMPVSSGLTTTTRSTCGSRIRATSQQLPVTSNATRSDASKLSAKHHQTLRRARHPSAGPHLALLADRDHAEVTVNVQADRATDPPRQSHPHLHRRNGRAGEPAGQRHRPIRARSTIQASRRGGRTKSPGSKPIVQNGLPACVLPTEAPVPDHPTLRPDPDRDPAVHFHATKGGSRRQARFRS